MVVDLVNISYKEIEISANKSIEEVDTLIIYLQNNGDKRHFWCNEKFLSIVKEDIDD